MTAIASDLLLLASLPGADLTLDPVGVGEHGYIGHPVDHRTLFRNVSLVPAGGRLRLTCDGQAEFRNTWRLPDLRSLDRTSFAELQASAFVAAVKRIDLSESFLSLTGGLDSRTVLATLLNSRQHVPAATQTGPRLSLDARLAAKLCRSYGIEHNLVVVDHRFLKGLPYLVEQASSLSGGLASLSQATEIQFYRQLGQPFSARLSGNLGNQVGRQGTEGVSLRTADLDILSPAFRAAAKPAGHWLVDNLRRPTAAAIRFLLRKEVPFSSVANFGIGNHFATQQSPYADRPMIETLARIPAAGKSFSRSALRVRLRDLRHRFVGEPVSLSFQRRLISDVGGPIARIPINWGWRARGGVSPLGITLGTAAMVGALVQTRLPDRNGPRSIFERAGFLALANFREPRRWLRDALPDFVQDTVNSQSVRDAGIFDRRALANVLEEHFSGRSDHHDTVLFALDLALAHRIFCTRSQSAPRSQMPAYHA